MQSVWRAEGKEHVWEESVGHRTYHLRDRAGPNPAARLPQGYACRPRGGGSGADRAMEEDAQVDRAAGDRIPPFEHPPRRTLEGWGTLRSLEGWGTLLPRAFFE